MSRPGGRAERIRTFVEHMHADTAKYPGSDDNGRVIALGTIRAVVAPDSGLSDMQARQRVQEVLAAVDQFRAERDAALRAAIDRAGRPGGRRTGPVTP